MQTPIKSINEFLFSIDPSQIAVNEEWMSATNLMNSSDIQLKYLWGNFLQSQGIVGIVGPSDTGKSRFVRQLAYSIVQGREKFIDFDLHAIHKRVYYVATEDNRPALKGQIELECGSEWKAESLKGLEILFKTSDTLSSLRKKLATAPADLVVLDSWADNFNGHPNDLVSVRRNLDLWSRLSEEFNCLVLLIHHNSKNSENYNPDKNRANGSQAFEARLRCLMDFRDAEDEDERLLTIVKNNYMPRKDKHISYILTLDNIRLLFSNTGRTLSKATNAKDNGKIKFDPKYWVPKMRYLRESKGLSLTAAHKLLVAETTNEDVPSLTWFKKAFSEDDRGEFLRDPN